MTLYFLSGLGADKRIFQKLRLPDSYKIVHIDWIRPEKDETIIEYAQRLSLIIDQQERFVIIGLSFGGLVATELSKIVKPLQTIIISSIASNDQLPLHLSVIKYLNIHKLIPEHFLKVKSPLVYWFMGARTLREKVLFNQILNDTDIVFFRWAVSAILHWKNTSRVNNLFHIHGDKDNIFPIQKTSPDYTIKNGGHLMVYADAKEISFVLNKIIAT